MKTLPQLSQTEWLLMEVLWRESPLSASEVHDRSQATTDCHVKTVRTMLDRLLAKGAVSREKKHGVWVFRPAFERGKFLLQESRSFLDRFFGGDPAPLFAHLVKNEVLTVDEIERLRRMIKPEPARRRKTDHER